MISSTEFIRQSLELHLFFGRLMKEHAFFLQTSFTPKDGHLIGQADSCRKAFDKLLAETISLSNGIVSPEVLSSGEVVTLFTLNAEKVSACFTGVDIPTELTRAEQGLVGSNKMICNPILEQKVDTLNEGAIELVTALVQFKMKVLEEVLQCRIFTRNYPTLLQHVIDEGNLYLEMVKRLQQREPMITAEETYAAEAFWNHIMGDHGDFIRGLLDPSEEELIKGAEDFSEDFHELSRQAQKAMEKAMPTPAVTDESLEETMEIKDFKQQATQGLLECKIKSVIIPLLSDHVLREANYYLRLLKMFKHECK